MERGEGTPAPAPGSHRGGSDRTRTRDLRLDRREAARRNRRRRRDFPRYGITRVLTGVLNSRHAAALPCATADPSPGRSAAVSHDWALWGRAAGPLARAGLRRDASPPGPPRVHVEAPIEALRGPRGSGAWRAASWG